MTATAYRRGHAVTGADRRRVRGAVAGPANSRGQARRLANTALATPARHPDLTAAGPPVAPEEGWPADALDPTDVCIRISITTRLEGE